MHQAIAQPPASFGKNTPVADDWKFEPPQQQRSSA